MLQGLYLRFAPKILPGANARVHALARTLLAAPIAGVREVVPGIVTLYLQFDPKRIPERRLRKVLRCRLQNLSLSDAANVRLIDLPVRYDGEDLGDVARQIGLTEDEVIARHSARVYTVYLIGFSPGQPYLGDLDPRLEIPRRPSPRTRVPASSLVIANSLTTIGPFVQPTGWSVLGQVLDRLYDPHRAEAVLLRPGDRVRFTPARGAAPSEPQPLELLPERPRHPFLQVHQPGLLDLVVDRGHRFSEHLGLASGGPVDSRSARLANALVGNADEAALIELNLVGPILEALASGVVAFAGWGMRPLVNGSEVESFSTLALRRGDVLSFHPTSTGVRGYLAVSGGIDSERYLGSASVSLRGRIGRPLVAGDVLGVSTPRALRPGHVFQPTRSLPSETVALRVVPGPQATSSALESLTSSSFTVTSADRVGVRLAGPAVPGGELVSEAVPIGAIQVPPGGAPILLLNDRGTTGGYAKPALLYPRDLPLAGQLRPGNQVRFSLWRQRTPLFRDMKLF